jgi:hypothetical protein
MARVVFSPGRSFIETVGLLPNLGCGGVTPLNVRTASWPLGSEPSLRKACEIAGGLCKC